MRSGVIFTGALTDSPNEDGFDSDVFNPGLVLGLAANGEHLLLFVGNCALDSQSRFLFNVAHAIFFLRPTKSSGLRICQRICFNYEYKKMKNNIKPHTGNTRKKYTIRFQVTVKSDVLNLKRLFCTFVYPAAATF